MLGYPLVSRRNQIKQLISVYNKYQEYFPNKNKINIYAVIDFRNWIAHGMYYSFSIKLGNMKTLYNNLVNFYNDLINSTKEKYRKEI